MSGRAHQADDRGQFLGDTGVMTGRREYKKQQVRQRLFDTAIALFEAEGYDAVSVDRIVAEAGVAKGTFFNHFPSKADVLAAWYERLVSEALSGLPGPEAGLFDRVFAPGIALVELTRMYPEMFASKTREASRTPALQRVEREGDLRMRDYLRGVFEQARQAGQISAAHDPHALAALGLTLTTGAVREWMIHETPAPDMGTHLSERIAQFVQAIEVGR